MLYWMISIIHLMDSEINLFEITEDPEWDEYLPVSEQKFKIKPKA